MSQYVQTNYQPTAGLLPDMSDNEKRLVSIAVIGIVGWMAFGKKIKKALK